MLLHLCVHSVSTWLTAHPVIVCVVTYNVMYCPHPTPSTSHTFHNHNRILLSDTNRVMAVWRHVGAGRRQRFREELKNKRRKSDNDLPAHREGLYSLWPASYTNIILTELLFLLRHRRRFSSKECLLGKKDSDTTMKISERWVCGMLKGMSWASAHWKVKKILGERYSYRHPRL